MPRSASRRLVAGRGQYVDDVPVKGELHAAFLRSPHAHATFSISDTSAARATDGVVAIYTAADLAKVCSNWQCVLANAPTLSSPPQGPLADGEALFQGEPVALVIAHSRDCAEDALDGIDVTWEPRPAATKLASTLVDAPPVHSALANNLCWETQMTAGDVDGAFRRAALVAETCVTFARKTGVPLEPRGILANFDPSAETLTVHVSHQMPHQLQLYLSRLLNLPMNDVRIVCGDVGGAFGVKMHIYPEEVAICAASKLLGRPVKFIADRFESMVSDIHAREHIIGGRMAVDEDGRILAFDIDDLQGLGAYSVYPRSSTMEGLSALRAVGGPYFFETFRARLRSALQNKSMIGQYRSVGHPVGTAITERLVELAAAKRGENSIDFRRRNFVPLDAMPWKSPSGARMVDLSHHACLDRLVELLDYDALRAEIAAGRQAGRLLGLGFASFVEFTATGPEGYGRAGVDVAAVDTAILTLQPSGQLRVQCSASEIGQGIGQGLAQIAADAVGVPVEDVRVVLGDTGATPHGGGAWSSRGAAIAGEATWAAGQTLRTSLLAIAASLLQSKVDELAILRGRVVDAASGVDRMGVDELGHVATFQSYDLPAGSQPQLSASAQWRRDGDPFLPTNGIQACLVEIDRLTGITRVVKHWAVEDCGRIINPLLVDEQIRGGIVQGLGEALLEECDYDEEGTFLSGTLADYLLPMAGDMPDIVIRHVETPYSGTALGAKGAGEAGTCGSATAVLNAVNDALAPHGAKVDIFPITPTAVLRALGELDAS